jgi:DNA-directed RNA polymerase sigma subunit (sigma70/sigma32)
MPLHDSRLIASALFAGLIAMPGVALAQTGEAATPPAAEDRTEQQTRETLGQAETVTPTDEQLESFAAATIDIVQIQETAQAQMQAAVEEAGLTIEEYNAIARAAQTDPDVDQALKELIQKRLGG